MLETVRSSERVIAWVLAAASVAALVYPIVVFFQRYMPRALAVVLVFVVVLGSIGVAGYALIDDLQRETHRLQQAAPRRAAELEKGSDLFRELKLRARVKSFVDDIPKRLAGGSGANAIRSTANRGLAFVASSILTLFFVLYGRNLIERGLAQIHDARRRARAQQITHQASRRALGYARLMLAKAVIAGVIAWGVASLADTPGPAALGVWVALWSLVPIGGVLVGGVPIVVFAAAVSAQRAVVVAVVFIALAIIEWLVVKPRLERATMRLGSFVTVLVGFAGLELYGFSGALLCLLGAALFVAVLGELGPSRLVDAMTAPAGDVTRPAIPEAPAPAPPPQPHDAN